MIAGALLDLWDQYGSECEHGHGYATSCDQCAEEDNGLNEIRSALRAASSSAGKHTHTVLIVGEFLVEALVQRDQQGEPFLSLHGIRCDLSGEEPGVYYPKPISEVQS